VRRTRNSLLRRVVMWTARVVLVVSVAGWVASLHYWEWNAGPRAIVRLAVGELRVLGGEEKATRWRDKVTGVQVLRFPSGTSWEVVLPLWIPTAAATSAHVATYFVSRRSRRWRCAGRCSACGYDLTGITGPCPECGSERETEA